MTVAEFPDHLEVLDRCDDPEPGALVANHRYETVNHIADRVLADLTLAQLESATAQGRNVDHVTRVTGYFSRVSMWNPSKRGELKDRAKVRL